MEERINLSADADDAQTEAWAQRETKRVREAAHGVLDAFLDQVLSESPRVGDGEQGKLQLIAYCDDGVVLSVFACSSIEKGL